MRKVQLATSPGIASADSRTAAKMLDVAYIPQYRTNWCWAACMQMVRQCLGLTHIDQWAMAMTERHVSAGCGLRCERFPLPGERGTLPLAEIVKEIDRKRPVGLQLGDIATGHVVLVVGYGPGGRLEIFDPDRAVGHTSISYAMLATSGYQGKTWVASFYNFAARPSDFDA